MNRGSSLTAAAYSRAVERRWSSLAEHPIVLSPRDWSRLSDWHSRAVPLEIVLEALDDAAERRRKRGARAPRSLTEIVPAVEEAWSVVREGRLEGRPRPERPLATVSQRIRGRLTAEPSGSELARLLEELLVRSDDGENPERLDEALDRELSRVAGESLLAEVREGVWRDLAPYRSRMPAREVEATVHAATLERLRRRLDLPRLADGS